MSHSAPRAASSAALTACAAESVPLRSAATVSSSVDVGCVTSAILPRFSLGA
ncbi:MAG: hypothetical protein MZV70_00225 [Desulfobacterales bacterium]|nr:hypothetical protein [Desulfobacterales bacterium]